MSWIAGVGCFAIYHTCSSLLYSCGILYRDLFLAYFLLAYIKIKKFQFEIGCYGQSSLAKTAKNRGSNFCQARNTPGLDMITHCTIPTKTGSQVRNANDVNDHVGIRYTCVCVAFVDRINLFGWLMSISNPFQCYVRLFGHRNIKCKPSDWLIPSAVISSV
jgi:hypothetical protein